MMPLLQCRYVFLDIMLSFISPTLPMQLSIDSIVIAVALSQYFIRTYFH